MKNNCVMILFGMVSGYYHGLEGTVLLPPNPQTLYNQWYVCNT